MKDKRFNWSWIDYTLLMILIIYIVSIFLINEDYSSYATTGYLLIFMIALLVKSFLKKNEK